MADDLDENYELEEKYRPNLANDVSDEETEISSVPSDNKSKKRKFEDLVSNGNKANILLFGFATTTFASILLRF